MLAKSTNFIFCMKIFRKKKDAQKTYGILGEWVIMYSTGLHLMSFRTKIRAVMACQPIYGEMTGGKRSAAAHCFAGRIKAVARCIGKCYFVNPHR